MLLVKDDPSFDLLLGGLSRHRQERVGLGSSFHRAGLVGEEDVWRIIARPENYGAHFAPYPIELVERCLDCGCPKGGVVLDPFVGSGTTMIAALSRGCSAIGVDLKPEYSGYTMDRITRDFGALY